MNTGVDLSDVVLDLYSVGDTPRQIQGWLPPERLPHLAEGCRSVEAAARAELRAERAFHGEGLRIHGEISGKVGLTCSRCLKEFSLGLEALVERRFVSGEDPAKGVDEREMVDDTEYLPENRLKLATVIEEELILLLPMIPLCREACAGLCGQCGANLNDGPCGCAPLEEDGPFAALKKLSGT